MTPADKEKTFLQRVSDGWAWLAQRWPELVVAAVILLGFFAIIRPQQPQKDPGAQVPIPAAKLEGGIEFLSPGQPVSLNAIVPNASKTPEVQATAYGEVIEARGTAAPVVLFQVAPESADALLKASVAEGAKITYRLLPGTATPTPTTDPSAPPPTATPTPPGPRGELGNARGYLELPVADIQPRASTLVTTIPGLVSCSTGTRCNARLVIVEKQEEAPADKPEAVLTTYSAKAYCVAVEAFLDASGYKVDRFVDAKTTPTVLVSFEIGKLAEIAASHAAAANIWLENDSNCK